MLGTVGSSMLAEADAAWVHTLDSVAFSAGPLTIRWYGLAYLAGFLIAFAMLKVMARRELIRIPADRVVDFILYVGLGVIIGGRLGYCLLYKPELFVAFDASSFPWWGVLRINEGGMASHGGIAGLIVGAWLFGRTIRVPLTHCLDALALVAPPGLFLGRVTNFVNGELLGRVVAPAGSPSPWWSVKFPQELLEQPSGTLPPFERLQALSDATQVPMTESIDAILVRAIEMSRQGDPQVVEALAPMLAARHPSQLYQAGMEGLLLVLLLWWIWRKPRRDGTIGCMFLVLYGLGRIATEHWRLPDAHFDVAKPFGLSRGQWYSIIMVLGGGLTLLALRRRPGEKSGGWASNKPAAAPKQVEAPPSEED